MSIRVWNALTRRKEDLEPLEPPRLRLFVCGPTVYDDAHLGHAYARAGDHIRQIVSQVERLVARGHAYELPDGHYFDITSFPGYGKLARRTDVGPQDSVSRLDENPLKRHPAQMESISGRAPLARYWLHAGLLTLRDAKMSKSAGNVFTIRGVLANTPPRVLRFFLIRHRYRSSLEFDGDLLRSAAAALQRLFLAPALEASDDDAWVAAEVQRRDRLRRERRFAEADEIRERLREEHAVVEDTGASSRWHRRESRT